MKKKILIFFFIVFAGIGVYYAFSNIVKPKTKYYEDVTYNEIISKKELE